MALRSILTYSKVNSILSVLWKKQLSPYLSQLSNCSQDIIDHTWVWIRVWVLQFQN